MMETTEVAVSSDLDKIWEEALEVYARITARSQQKSKGIFKKFHTSKELLTDLDSPKTPKDLENLVQDRNDKFAEWRSPKDHPKLWSNLQTCLSPLSKFSSIIEWALNSSPFAPAATVFGAVVFLINSAQGVSDAYDYIASLLAQLSEFTIRMDYYLQCVVDSHLQKKLVEIMSTLLEILARAEDAIRKGRFREYLKVTFKGHDDKIEVAKEKLKILFVDEQGLVLAKAYASTQQVKVIAARTEGRVSTIESIAGRTEANTIRLMSAISGSKDAAKEMKDLESLKETLEASSLDKVRRVQREYLDQLNMVDRRGTGAAKWFQDLDLFKDWIGKKAPLLWILGPSGTGKSCLSSRMIEDLRVRFPQNAEHPVRISVAYFYIDADDPNLSSVDIILKSIAYQIARNDQVYRNYAINMCKNPDGIVSTIDIWTKLFVNFFGDSKYPESSAFVVVDGLDRASDSEQAKFLDILATLEQRQSIRPRLQFALLGDTNVRGDKWSLNWRKPIEIAKANTADVVQHVKSSVRRIKILRPGRLPSEKERLEFQAEIIQKLTAGANGRFTWVDLVIKKVLDKGYKEVVRAAVDNASHDFLELIWQAFKNLATTSDEEEEFNELDDFKTILIWITFAERPMLLGEIATIVRLDKPNHAENTLLEEELRGKFATFFTLHRDDRRTTQFLTANAWQKYRERIRDTDTKDRFEHESDDVYDDEDEDDFGPDLNFHSDQESTTVTFSDETFKDFMALEINPATRKFPVIPELAWDRNLSHYSILMSCLTTLCDHDHTTIYGSTNLLIYAAEYFGTHFVELDTSKLSSKEKNPLTKLLIQLFSDRECLQGWIRELVYVKFLKTWLCDDTLSRKICNYLTLESQSISAAEIFHQDQSQPLWASGATLFHELSKYCQSQWLTDKASGVLFWVYFLDLKLRFTDEGFPDAAEAPAFEDLTLKISRERIQLLANASDLEKDAVWHRRLGLTFRQASHVDAALEEFHIALKLDPSEDFTYMGIARSYAVKEEYEKAIDWTWQALNHIPADRVTAHPSEPFLLLSKWSLEIDKVEDAIKYAIQARAAEPRLLSPVSAHLVALNQLEVPDVTRLFHLLNELKSLPSETAELSLLTAVFKEDYTMQTVVCSVAKTLEHQAFLIATYKRGEEEFESVGDHFSAVTQRYLLGSFLSDLLYRFEEAIEIFEDIMAIEVDTTNESVEVEDEWNTLKSGCIQSLSAIYSKLGTAAKEEGADLTYYMEKLENLVKKEYKHDGVWGSGQPSLALSLLYRQDNRHEEADNAVRQKILDSLDVLEDDDVENDIEGYLTLAQNLILAHRWEDGMDAYAVLLMSLDTAKEIRQQRQARIEAGLASSTEELILEDETTTTDPTTLISTGVPEPSLSSPPAEESIDLTLDSMTRNLVTLWTTTNGGCDGPCSRKGVNFTHLYQCKSCMDSGFCELCIVQHKAGELEMVKFCTPAHEFLEVYPVEEKRKHVATTIKDGRIIPRKEWLVKLRAEWSLKATATA